MMAEKTKMSLSKRIKAKKLTPLEQMSLEEKNKETKSAEEKQPIVLDAKNAATKPEKKSTAKKVSVEPTVKQATEPAKVEIPVLTENAFDRRSDKQAPAKEAKKANNKTDENAAKNKKQSKQNSDEEPKKKIWGFIPAIQIKKKKKEETPLPRVRRVKTDYKIGLSAEQVQERIDKGQTNATQNTNVKTYGAIFFENIVTFFNILCLAIAIALACVGAYKDLMFMLIIVANTAIGIFQEIKAKRSIEKLSLLTAPTVVVVRGGQKLQIATSDVVIDDIVYLGTGKQIVADCVLLEGSIEVNESLLTGESLPIKKKVGDTILSGSFVVSGTGYVRVTKVGKACYVEQLAGKAKKYRRPKSELMGSLKNIIRVIGFIIIPLGIAMCVNNYFRTGKDVADTVRTTAGSLIGMIPAGMYLLSSVALTVSVIRLARQKALVQDLYCVEMLARVNVLCLDKTGTITDGTMKVYNSVEINNNSGFTLKRIMGSFLSALSDNNQTSQALINYFGFNKELKPIQTLPFSSSRKLSAVSFENMGTYILGAPEFVVPNNKDEKLVGMIEQYAKDGYRVLMLARAEGAIANSKLPDGREIVAIFVLEDRIRDDAEKTIKWFRDNGVDVKIISGDNPMTVAEIAKRVGVEHTEAFVNLEGMNEKQVIAAANKYTVFGRVTPEQKAILVKALKSAGNTVAMTGDGVNDILALKEADCSIAMASGSEAVRSVSHMVLLDSNFASMPQTVFEGRRVINNVQRASSLFFMKTIFSIIFSIFVLAIQKQYPFGPFQLILLEYFVIGIPSFFLALKPNSDRISGKFIVNLFKNAIPGGLALIINVCAVYAFVFFTTGNLNNTDIISSMATIILTMTGLAQLLKLCRPFNVMTAILFSCMFAICFFVIIFAGATFGIVAIGLQNILFLIILSILAPYLIAAFSKVMDWIKI